MVKWTCRLFPQVHGHVPWGGPLRHARGRDGVPSPEWRAAHCGHHGRLSEPATGQHHHRPPAHSLRPRRVRIPQEAMLHIGYPDGEWTVQWPGGVWDVVVKGCEGVWRWLWASFRTPSWPTQPLPSCSLPRVSSLQGSSGSYVPFILMENGQYSGEGLRAVSYTHLTLPTKTRV